MRLKWMRALLAAACATTVTTTVTAMAAEKPAEPTEAELYYRNFDLADRAEPAPVTRPFFFTPERLTRARRNLQNCAWAKKVYRDARRTADALGALSAEELIAEMPELPGSSCSCPKCRQPSNVAWRDLVKNDMRMVCSDCRTEFPNPDYPEDQVLEVRLANGRVQRIPYYRGKSDKLNEGDRYFLSGVVREARLRRVIDRMPQLALVCALDRRPEDGKRAREILLRLAEIYPGLPARLRNTYYPTFGNDPIEGKLYRWKFGDSQCILKIVMLYDAVRDTGVFSDADRVKIENGIFREYKRMMTAFPPWRDLTNSLPTGYAGMAWAGRVLADHEMIAWVVRGPESFEVFLNRWFHRDGFWHENTCSYQTMALNRMDYILEGLTGYSDPADYRGADRFDRLEPAATAPMLGKAYVAMATATMPDGRLPGLNDSIAAYGFPLHHLKSALRYFNSPMAREVAAMLTDAGGAEPLRPGVEDVLLFEPSATAPAENAELPAWRRLSRIVAGPRWLLLRGGRGCALVLDAGELDRYHAHYSSNLNFLYFDHGRELVPDLGYLTAQHKDTPFNKSIVAHQTVMVDDRPHEREGRRTDILAYAGNTPEIQIVRARSPKVAPGVVDRFDRTLFLVDRGEGDRYVADLFRVRGGSTHTYLFHGLGKEFAAPEGMRFAPFQLTAPHTGANRLTEMRSAPAAGPLTFRWRSGGVTTRYQMARGVEAEAVLARAPGNRDISKPLSKEKMNVLMLRRGGPESRFGGIVEGVKDDSLPERKVELTAVPGGMLLQVTRGDRTDLLLVPDEEAAELRTPDAVFSGGAAAVSLKQGSPDGMWVAGGGTLTFRGETLTAPVTEGTIVGFNEAERTITLDRPVTARAGDYLEATGHRDGFYRIESVAGAVVTVEDTAPYRLTPGDAFRLAPAAHR